MLAFSRRTGGKNHLFGSSIEHNNVIAMTLRHGEVTRELNTDWYHGDKIIAEIEMSYSQFAEAISSMNRWIRLLWRQRVKLKHFVKIK